MAGLYELWPDPERESDDPQRWVWTITVLTTIASDALGQIHDRSPVVIPPALQDAWLDHTLPIRSGCGSCSTLCPSRGCSPMR